MSIKILLVDDLKITRQGLRALLDKEPDMEVVGEADEGRAALKLVRELSPNVVIMDVGMPDMNGIEASRHILNKFSNVKIIVLTIHADTMIIAKMFKSGVSAYLLKDCALEELLCAVRTVMAGKIYLGSTISSVVVDDYLRRLEKTDFSNLEILTNREREVLQLIAEGTSTKQIALKLHISAKTVETHRRQIMIKLDIHSVAELTKYAIKKGLVFLDK